MARGKPYWLRVGKCCLKCCFNPSVDPDSFTTHCAEHGCGLCGGYQSEKMADWPIRLCSYCMARAAGCSSREVRREQEDTLKRLIELAFELGRQSEMTGREGSPPEVMVPAPHLIDPR
jgi:hypothetical protein